MSFRCEKCTVIGERPNRLVVERKMVNHFKDGEPPRGPRGGQGSQIVREMNICNACAGVTAEAPIERAEPVATSSMEQEDFNNIDELAS